MLELEEVKQELAELKDSEEEEEMYEGLKKQQPEEEQIQTDSITIGVKRDRDPEN